MSYLNNDGTLRPRYKAMQSIGNFIGTVGTSYAAKKLGTKALKATGSAAWRMAKKYGGTMYDYANKELKRRNKSKNLRGSNTSASFPTTVAATGRGTKFRKSKVKSHWKKTN